MSTDSPDLATSVQALTVAVADMAGALEDQREDVRILADYGKRNRNFIKLLTATVIFDLLMSCTIGTIGYKAFTAANQARHASSLAERNRAAAVTQCLSGNDFRAADKARWEYVINLSAGSGRPQTEQQQSDLAKFRAYIEQADAPRDCSQVGR